MKENHLGAVKGSRVAARLSKHLSTTDSLNSERLAAIYVILAFAAVRLERRIEIAGKFTTFIS